MCNVAILYVHKKLTINLYFENYLHSFSKLYPDNDSYPLKRLPVDLCPLKFNADPKHIRCCFSS
jgi:hypothetical protein